MKKLSTIVFTLIMIVATLPALKQDLQMASIAQYAAMPITSLCGSLLALQL